MADMDCDNAAGAIGVLVPDLFINLGRGKYAPGIFHQEFQDIVFAGCQIDNFPVHGNNFCVIIQVYSADDQMGGFFRHAAQRGVPAQLGTYPCQNFDGIEGLCDIIIGANVQPQYLIAVLAFCCQQYNRDIAGFPELRCGRNSVHLWHHDIH